ncbi:MAG: metal ABC transporter substrate-binding protein [Phycicoccus sp.]|nr:metal ABC transporter substrate-binding protein [Phycicoccus sp.]MCB9405238.1 zinc ABC transporter substrate-binding protein [Tetrasphaera sp.]MCO5303666.1 metal ABC transporter substrate-binding protein [Phycicoccus sp.]HPQ72770.1 metal ABC transporter substrate-binding protein [Phycicoccus elongatus]
MIVMLRRVLPALVLGTLALTGCAAPTRSADSRVHVVAAFYPLAYAAQQVGGDRVTVETLTKPGGEPHDLELLPRQILDIQDAALVVHLSHFQPAVDAAVAAHAAERSLDVAEAADLLTLTEEHDHGAVDPHFWLDPTRLAAVGEAIADRLAQADPAGAAAYRANAAAFTAQLTTLDAEVETGLATCTNRDLVTGHSAFGYFAERYGFTQEPISGLSPDLEPRASDLAHVVEFVREHDVRTIYAETIASPLITQALARETGARVAVLDTVEGISDESAAADYPGVMRANLATLRLGQDCP